MNEPQGLKPLRDRALVWHGFPAGTGEEAEKEISDLRLEIAEAAEDAACRALTQTAQKLRALTPNLVQHGFAAERRSSLRGSLLLPAESKCMGGAAS